MFLNRISGVNKIASKLMRKSFPDCFCGLDDNKDISTVYYAGFEVVCWGIWKSAKIFATHTSKTSLRMTFKS